MAIAPAYAPHRITIEECHRMAAAGVFDSDARIERIDGELIGRVAPFALSEANLRYRICGRIFAARASRL